MIEGELALALFASVCILLLFGFPVALTLGGTALLFASFGVIAGHFDASFVAALSGRIFGRKHYLISNNIYNFYRYIHV